MARPAQVLLVAVLYIVGMLVAKASNVPLDSRTILAGLAALIPITISIHYANEYADYETDSLTKRTVFSGGSGTIPSGLIKRDWALAAAWGMLSAGLLIALSLQINLIALLVLLIGTFGGWMYSLPPLALAWRGCGELDNAFLGGMVLPIYGYAVQAGHVDIKAVLVFVPFTLLVFINLLATTWADRDADEKVGKKTLAVLWSPRQLRLLYVSTSALALLTGMSLSGTVIELEILLGSVFVIPFIGWGILRYTRIRSPHPTVYAMIVLVLVYLFGWYVVAV